MKKIVDYFNISIDDILIIADDLDLLLGNFKLRPSGSCGGHNGLRSIESYLASSSFKRLKIGISNNKNMDTKDYVLGSLSKSENDIIQGVFETVCDVLDDYLKIPFSDLMSKYNRKNR